MRDILTILLYGGQLGTCMAWAMGYYYRTYLRASALNLSADDLAKPENQFSPKYLYIIAAADGADYSEGLNRTRVSYKNKTATIYVSVENKTHKITYLVDSEEYEVVNNVVVGFEIVFIDEPVKDGYTFSGWSSNYSKMPNYDITQDNNASSRYSYVTLDVKASNMRLIYALSSGH